MRATIGAAFGVVCALSLVACGTSGHRAPPRPPAQQVSDAVSALQHDLSTRNFRHLCEQVFSSQARIDAGGKACPTILANESAGVRNPRIAIKRIEVRGRSATARVVTSSVGQARAAETIQLVMEGGRFRILALATR
jgi:hypothetical protein